MAPGTPSPGTANSTEGAPFIPAEDILMNLSLNRISDAISWGELCMQWEERSEWECESECECESEGREEVRSEK